LEQVSDDELPELELEEELTPAASHKASRRGAAGEANEVEVTLSETGAEQERFEDLDALESELASVTGTEPRAASSEILSRIEDELRSIRADLTQLRSELSGMRKPGAEPAVSAPPTGSESQSGFFDEDEDETIALTGDELDNILNTAEITEEAAEAAPVDEPMDLSELEEEAPQGGPQEDLGLETAELLPETSAEPSTEELPAELDLEDLSAETSTPKSDSDAGLPELDLEGIPEIETTEKGFEASEEIGDIETLDLEEETGDLEPLEQPSEPKHPAENTEELAGDVDLEALAAEAEALEGDEAAVIAEDLEFGELEAVTDDAGGPLAGNQDEIEIPFENEQNAGRTSKPEVASDELLEVEEVPAEKATPGRAPAAMAGAAAIPDDLKDEIRTVLKYMDNLLEALPDEKIQEFAKSDYFVMYKKLFEDLGLGE
jgi:hypothetical protein